MKLVIPGSWPYLLQACYWPSREKWRKRFPVSRCIQNDFFEMAVSFLMYISTLLFFRDTQLSYPKLVPISGQWGIVQWLVQFLNLLVKWCPYIICKIILQPIEPVCFCTSAGIHISHLHFLWCLLFTSSELFNCHVGK